jgi:hypothetical protein
VEKVFETYGQTSLEHFYEKKSEEIRECVSRSRVSL